MTSLMGKFFKMFPLKDRKIYEMLRRNLIAQQINHKKMMSAIVGFNQNYDSRKWWIPMQNGTILRPNSELGPYFDEHHLQFVPNVTSFDHCQYYGNVGFHFIEQNEKCDMCYCYQTSQKPFQCENQLSMAHHYYENPSIVEPMMNFNHYQVQNNYCRSRQTIYANDANNQQVALPMVRNSNTRSNGLKGQTQKRNFLEEKELDELVSRVAEEASNCNLKITWLSEDNDDEKKGESAIKKDVSTDKCNFRHRSPRKQANPHKSANKYDPNFKGVALTMQIRLQGKQPELVIQPSFSAKLRCRNTKVLPKETANVFGSRLRISKGKVCVSCKRKRSVMWHKTERNGLMCNTCHNRFKRNRVRCSKCWKIPELEKKHRKRCKRCGAILKSNKRQ